MDNINKMYQISFNGNRLDQIPGVTLHWYNFTNLPSREMSVHKLARRDKSILTSAEYSTKQITISLEICSGTRQDAEQTLSQVKAQLQSINGSLRVLQANREVEYTATLQEFETEWLNYRAYCTITMLATDPIGRSSNSVNLFTMTGITTASRSVTFAVDGSFNAEPEITIVINTVTGGTGQTINLFNSRTNQGLTLTDTFVAGDIINVDCNSYTVQKNGIEMDYTGTFPVFPAGQQAFTYSDTFTTRSVDVSATYKPRYS